MSYLNTFLWLLCLPCVTCGQELVPNGSFEDFTSCPDFASQLGKAAPWFNATAGTPELYHACAGSGAFAGVPANFSGGFQWPRTGQGFAGLYSFMAGLPNQREYIAVPLLEPLEAGRCYRFTMHVNRPNDFELACDGIGARFSIGPITSDSATVLPYPAHVEHLPGQLITDTLGWTAVTGTYTAIGGEDHLTIGNFRSDAQTLTMPLIPGAWYQNQAYYLVDDVSVVPLEDLLDLGPDTTICEGASIVLHAEVPGAGSWLWSDGSASPVLTVDAQGAYSVTVNAEGCIFRDTVVVSMHPMPVVDLGMDVGLCPGGIHVLRAMTNLPEAFAWSDGSNALERQVSAPGLYSAMVSNACGSATDEVEVRLEDCPEAILFPNAFTPNGDGINDDYAPVYDARLWNLRFDVFDRWGLLVFSGRDGERWHGGSAVVGCYSVRVEADSRARSAEKRVLAGHVMLLR